MSAIVYLAHCPECDGILMFTMSDPSCPETLKNSAKHVADCIKRGMRIDSCSNDDARTGVIFGHVTGCPRNGQTINLD